MYVCTYVRTYVRMYACMYVCVNMCMELCKHIYIYVTRLQYITSSIKMYYITLTYVLNICYIQQYQNILCFIQQYENIVCVVMLCYRILNLKHIRLKHSISNYFIVHFIDSSNIQLYHYIILIMRW